MKKSNKAAAEFQAYYELFKSILKNEKENEYDARRAYVGKIRNRTTYTNKNKATTKI